MAVDIRDREPMYQDEVRSKNNDTAGVVIAKYVMPTGPNVGKTCLDVRSTEDRIYYGTLMENWVVTSTEEDRL